VFTTVFSDVIDGVAMVTGFGRAEETVLTTAAGGTGWGILALLYRQKDKQRKRKKH
jgi:hypothetical protein